MPDISQITLPSGNTYDIADSTARQDIADLQETVTQVMHWVGTTTTPLSEGATTNPITVDGESVTVTTGAVADYDGYEYAFNINGAWQRFGPTGAFGALAFKSSASGSVTPSGTVSQPTFTGDTMTATGTTTPEGTVSTPIITLNPTTATVDEVTDVGSMPTFTVSNGVLTITGGQTPTTAPKTVMTGAAPTSSQPTFTGAENDISVTGTPSGTVSQPTFSGDTGTVTVS